MREKIGKSDMKDQETMKREPRKRKKRKKTEPRRRKRGAKLSQREEQVEGGANREGRKDCLNHRLTKEAQGYSPQGGDQIFSGSTKDQPRINYS